MAALEKQKRVFPNRDGANWATSNGHLEVLKWMAELDNPVFSNQDAADRAAKNDHIEVLEWIGRIEKSSLARSTRCRLVSGK